MLPGLNCKPSKRNIIRNLKSSRVCTMHSFQQSIKALKDGPTRILYPVPQNCFGAGLSIWYCLELYLVCQPNRTLLALIRPQTFLLHFLCQWSVSLGSLPTCQIVSIAGGYERLRGGLSQKWRVAVRLRASAFIIQVGICGMTWRGSLCGLAWRGPA